MEGWAATQWIQGWPDRSKTGSNVSDHAFRETERAEGREAVMSRFILWVTNGAVDTSITEHVDGWYSWTITLRKPLFWRRLTCSHPMAIRYCSYCERMVR